MLFRASTRLPGIVFLLFVAILANSCGGGTTSEGASKSTGTSPASISLSSTPASLTINPGASFQLNITVATAGTTSTPSISLGTLPAGVTPASALPMAVPNSTATLQFLTQSSMAAGNYTIPIQGTAGGASAQASIALTVVTGTPVSSAGWTNQTDYTSTRATPFQAVYDPAHRMIYSSNQTWNSVDLISDASHAIVKSIPIRDPRGLDISADGSCVWVATGSQVIYSIDTTTYHTTRYQLPRIATSTSSAQGWEGLQIFSIADGTVMLVFTTATGSGDQYVAVWNPADNTLRLLPMPSNPSWVTRSGDATRIFFIGTSSFYYDSQAKTLTPAGVSGLTAVASPDGSRIAIDGDGFNLYDGNFNLIGPIPGAIPYNAGPINGFIFGGAVFSPDGSTLYSEILNGVNDTPLILSIDVATQQLIGYVPAMPVIPLLTEMIPYYYVPVPFAVDSAGLLLGIQYHGIAFDDPQAVGSFSANLPPVIYMQHMSPYSGPLEGNTASGGFGDAFTQTPDVYYGATRGVAVLSGGAPIITSPPATAPGTVNVKLLFPDGTEVFDPQFFTYGTWLQEAVISGAPPQGGVAGKLDGFGLSEMPTQNSVMVGENQATATSKSTTFTSEQSAMSLTYTIPQGVPGWTDLKVTTPNGVGTLSKAFFYAKSVTDYSLSDTPTFVIYDSKRNQLYLSAGNHIDVFSLNSNSFLTPLTPPALGSNSQFQGLALTPDGSSLLAANSLDGSLAVINPDIPANSYVINIAAARALASCTVTPFYVAADNQGEAFVVSSTSCSGNITIYVANLAQGTVTASAKAGCSTGAARVTSTGDGSMISFGGPFFLYSTATNACLPILAGYAHISVAAAADGNVFASSRAFVDPSGNIVGRMAHPPVFYPGSEIYSTYDPTQDGAYEDPALNASGSLYYWAYPNYIDIVDVQLGLPSLRLSLSETVSNTVSPMAIDDAGQHIFLITNEGLTVVDLGQPPLSVGHLSQTTASVGTQITVRGSGFESDITVAVGSTLAPVTYIDTSTLTFVVPAASGLQDLVLTNPGGKTYTLASALTVQ